MILDCGYVCLRRYDPRHIGEIADILLECYPEEKWTPEDVRHFSGHVRRVIREIILISDAGEFLVGALLYELKKQQCILRRLAIHPAFQRRGIGSYALGELVTLKSGLNRRHAFQIAVRERNVPAQLFLREALERLDIQTTVDIEDEKYPDTKEAAFVWHFLRPATVSRPYLVGC